MTEKITIFDYNVIRLTKDVSNPDYTAYTIDLNPWFFLSLVLSLGMAYKYYKTRIPSKYRNYKEMAKLFKNDKM
jgi:hypothetical protein